MRIFIATARNRDLDFGSVLYSKIFRDHLAQNEGEEFRIVKKNASTSEKVRAYYWAAVIPTLKEKVREWSSLTAGQVHEATKKLFNFFEAWNPLTERTERFGGPIMGDESTTAELMDYVSRIDAYLIEKYKEGLPNPEDYKKLRDSGRLLEEQKPKSHE